MTASEKAEKARYIVLAYYYDIPACAQSAETAARMIARQHPLTTDDVRDAILFLVDKGLLKHYTDDLGSTIYYQITADGQLSAERHRLA